jgi:hypothetical protein
MANEDLVELAIWDHGPSELAENRFLMARAVQECMRMRGSVCGGRDSRRYVPLQIVSFLSEMVRGDIARFRQYNAWPLVIRFNDRRHTFTPVVKRGQAVPM